MDNKNAGFKKNQPSARECLLIAAKKLFVNKPYTKVTIRSIADEAQVNSALISYYFINKSGLYCQMIKSAISEVANDIGIEMKSHSDVSPHAVFSAYNKAFLKTPQFPLLIFNELMSGNGQCRTQIIEHFKATIVDVITELRLELDRTGKLKEDIDTDLFLMSFISMNVTPWLLRSTFEEMTDRRYDEAFAQKLIKHNNTLFCSGLLHPPEKMLTNNLIATSL